MENVVTGGQEKLIQISHWGASTQLSEGFKFHINSKTTQG